MLAAGILKEQDWTGDFGSTLDQGLARWIGEELDAKNIVGPQLSLVYADNVRRMTWGEGLNAQQWVRYRKGLEDAPVGAFALGAQEYHEVFVGETVAALNAKYRNLGFHVLAVLSKALDRTIGAASPMWAIYQIEEWHWSYEDYSDEDIEEMDVPTPERFHARVPLRACRFETRRRTLLEARRLGLPDWLHTCVDLALQLQTRLPALSKLGTETWAFVGWEGEEDVTEYDGDQLQPVLPVSLRWSEDDRINRLSDDWHQHIAQCSTETDLVWMRGFQLALPETLIQAAADLRQVVEATVLASRLVNLMDQVPQSRARVRVGVQ